MCVGNTCGGMDVTTIYPAASGDPGLLVLGIGIAILVMIGISMQRTGIFSSTRMLLCAGIYS